MLLAQKARKHKEHLARLAERLLSEDDEGAANETEVDDSPPNVGDSRASRRKSSRLNHQWAVVSTSGFQLNVAFDNAGKIKYAEHSEASVGA